jgi:transcriptional regulator with XRE-family HTH domain
MFTITNTQVKYKAIGCKMQSRAIVWLLKPPIRKRSSVRSRVEPRQVDVERLAAEKAPEPPRVGVALALFRQRSGLSLDGLARQSGVSKSMLSQIERGRTNPTVAIVWRLAHALGVDTAELLQGGEGLAARQPLVLMPEGHTPTMRSSDGRCELRILGPVELAGRFEWYELILQPQGALRSEPHETGAREHLTVLSGSVHVHSGDQSRVVAAQQTVRYAADAPHSIVNESKTRVTAILVVLHPGH